MSHDGESLGAMPEPEAAPPAWPVRAIQAVTGPWTRENLAGWVKLILVVLVIRWAGCEPYFVPSGSMEPTLHGDPRFWAGDRVTVNKWIYGLRVPFMNKRLFRLRDPQRWDIVVFKTVQKNAEHTTLIKRIVGLPGERIHIDQGRLWVNGAPVTPPEALRDVLHYTTEVLPEPEDLRNQFVYLLERRMPPEVFKLNSSNQGVQTLFLELEKIREQLGRRAPATLSDAELDALLAGLSPVGRQISRELFSYQQAQRYPFLYGVREEDEYAVIPPGCYLVCGDNSGQSVDGRFFGWLPRDNIVGRAACIWWPVARWRDFTGFSKTWWGKGMLYGLALAGLVYIGVELVRAWRARRGLPPPMPDST